MGVDVSNPAEVEKLRKELLERLEKLKGEIEGLRREWEEVKQIGRRRR
jgi:DNA-binding FrmR family transcriptional regulator